MIKTKNIYYAAYLLTEGAEYIECETLTDIGSQTGVLFTFKTSSEKLEESLLIEYENNTAKVNIRKYLDNLIAVRTTMYEKLEKLKRKKNLKNSKSQGINNVTRIKLKSKPKQ